LPCYLFGIIAFAGDISCEESAKPAAGTVTRTTITQPGKWINSNLSIEVNSTDWITLKWAPVANAAYYRVYRSTKPSFDVYYDDVSDQMDETTFDDDRLDAGTTYYYWVYWFKADNSSGKIGQASAKTPTQDGPLN
jgi:fibronectin type 3 domain-containing protein